MTENSQKYIRPIFPPLKKCLEDPYTPFNPCVPRKTSQPTDTMDNMMDTPRMNTIIDKRITKNLFLSLSKGMYWFRYRGRGLCIDN